MEKEVVTLGRRKFLKLAAVGTAVFLSASSEIPDPTPYANIQDVITNMPKFKDKTIWTEGYYIDWHTPWSGWTKHGLFFKKYGYEVFLDFHKDGLYRQNLCVAPGDYMNCLEVFMMRPGYSTSLDINKLKKGDHEYEPYRVKGVVRQYGSEYIFEELKRKKINSSK